MNISILYGGVSTEHNISIQTGLAVAEAIKDIYNLDMININKIALGGIDYKYFNKLNLLDIVGVAGISMFKKKAP